MSACALSLTDVHSHSVHLSSRRHLRPCLRARAFFVALRAFSVATSHEPCGGGFGVFLKHERPGSMESDALCCGLLPSSYILHASIDCLGLAGACASQRTPRTDVAVAGRGRQEQEGHLVDAGRGHVILLSCGAGRRPNRKEGGPMLGACADCLRIGARSARIVWRHGTKQATLCLVPSAKQRECIEDVAAPVIRTATTHDRPVRVESRPSLIARRQQRVGSSAVASHAKRAVHCRLLQQTCNTRRPRAEHSSGVVSVNAHPAPLARAAASQLPPPCSAAPPQRRGAARGSA